MTDNNDTTLEGLIRKIVREEIEAYHLRHVTVGTVATKQDLRDTAQAITDGLVEAIRGAGVTKNEQ